MSKNIEINYKSDVGYEVLYPMVQTSSLLPGTLSGQFVFDTAPKSNVAASADDELLRLGEGRGEIESYWLERYPWSLEVQTGTMNNGQAVNVQLMKGITDYLMIGILCYPIGYSSGANFYITNFQFTFSNFIVLVPFKNGLFVEMGGRSANGFEQLIITAQNDSIAFRVYTF